MSSSTSTITSRSPPQLNGVHITATVVTQPRGLMIDVDPQGSGQKLTYRGYFYDILTAISQPSRGNFTFTLRPPSGYGTMCVHPTPPNPPNTTNTTTTTIEPYSSFYWNQYNCAMGDVLEEHPVPVPPGTGTGTGTGGAYVMMNTSTTTTTTTTTFTKTDMMLGLYYVFPWRLELVDFTVPVRPPVSTAITMIGTSQRIESIPDLVVQQQKQQQKQQKQKQQQTNGNTDGNTDDDDDIRVCLFRSYALSDFVRDAFPDLIVYQEISGLEAIDKLQDRTCTVIIGVNFEAMMQNLVDENKCYDVDGKPIGIIGRPLNFGPSHFAFGLSQQLPPNYKRTIDYWMNFLMGCIPDKDDGCGQDSFDILYRNNGGTVGTGLECGYVNFPPTDDEPALRPGGIAAVACGSAAIVAIVLSIIFFILHRRQKNRIRTRFVQQISRNIAIVPSPGMIEPEKLVEQIHHIGNDKGVIKKEDMARWLHDVKMEFLSEKDFDALWAAMDVDGKDEVNAVDFVVFLSSCGPQFEKVYEEQSKLPKTERLKLAARRLENINEMGEEGVRKIEHGLEKRARYARALSNAGRQASSTDIGISPKELEDLKRSFESPARRLSENLMSRLSISSVKSSSKRRKSQSSFFEKEGKINNTSGGINNSLPTQQQQPQPQPMRRRSSYHFNNTMNSSTSDLHGSSEDFSSSCVLGYNEYTTSPGDDNIIRE